MDDPSSSRKRKREKNRERNRRRNASRNPLRDADVFLRRTFYSIVPNKAHRIKSRELIQKVRTAIVAKFKNSEVDVYGSYGSGTALVDSDVDFCVKMETRNALFTIRRITDILLKIGIIVDDDLTRFDMPVPGGTVTVYFTFGLDVESGIHVDLSLNNPLAPISCAFVKAIVDFHFMEKMLLVLIKYFATCHDLNNKKKGLPNTGHIYLGVHVLHKNKVIPHFLKKEHVTDLSELVQEANSYTIVAENFSKSPAVTTVASLLLDYFKYYSEDVDYTTMAISIRGGCLVTKQSLGWPEDETGYRLAILDPFKGDNAGERVKRGWLRRMRKAFKHAREILEDGSRFERLFEPFDFNEITIV
ncbi:poly(A) RNA polymerase cid11-like [Apium graveolens]|uniref:poly(A) RNA polymerase cid11-like n=1 Tax=Apium graveolens TaxID=4045 RepID=UPI003D7B2E1F